MRFPATLLTIFCCICCSVAKAQSPYIAGGRALALGDAALLIHDVWAVHNDPAAMGEISHWQAGIWTERQYNLSALSSGALAVALPLGKKSLGTLGFGLYVFGGTAYFRQQKYNLSYALPLNRKLSAGIGLQLLNTRLAEPYGGQLTPIGELSILYKPNTKTQLAIRLWNMYPVVLSAWQQERLPTVIQAGILRKISPSISLMAELCHESGQPTSVHAGLEYKPAEQIALQAGIRTAPMAYAFGAGFQYQKINIHLGFQVQQVLGISPNVTLGYGQTADK